MNQNPIIISKAPGIFRRAGGWQNNCHASTPLVYGIHRRSGVVKLEEVEKNSRPARFRFSRTQAGAHPRRRSYHCIPRRPGEPNSATQVGKVKDFASPTGEFPKIGDQSSCSGDDATCEGRDKVQSEGRSNACRQEDGGTATEDSLLCLCSSIVPFFV